MNVKRLVILTGTALLGLLMASIWLWLLSGPPVLTRASGNTACRDGPPTCDDNSFQSVVDATSNGDDILAPVSTPTFTTQNPDFQEFQSSVPISGLLAYYPFNGNANDESGHGNDGTVFGATLTADRFGNPNSGYSFDGVDDYINLGDQYITDDSVAFSVSLWANISGGSDDGPTMIRLKGNTSEFQFAFRPIMPAGRAIYSGFRGFRNIMCNDNQYLLDNLNEECHHYSIVYEGGDKNSLGSYQIYVDGATISIHSTDFVGGSENENELGRDWWGLNHLDGILDDIRIYNRELTESEVLSLYYEGVTDPVVLGIEPNTAVANTGDLPVTISGLNLSTPISATIDAMPLLTPTLVSSTTLNAVLPVNNLDVGVYDLNVTSDGATATLHEAFTVGLAGPWYVATVGDDGNDCLSQATPCATINGALNKPGFLADSTVLVAAGVYTGTGNEVVLLNKNATLSGGWDASFTTQGGTSTIDGDEIRRGIVVAGGVTAVIDRFTVQHGYTDDGNGGGIHNSGILTVTNSMINDNLAEWSGYADHGGGGIYNIGALSLNHCTVSNNTSTEGGGGVYAAGGSSTVVMDSQIIANTANDWEGGGVQVHQDSDLSMSKSWVVGNAALGNDGGGIGSNNAGSVYIENSIVAGNSTGGTGGGLFFTDGRLYQIVNSHIVGNKADYKGAAIVGYYAQVEVTNTLIISNTGYTGIDDQGSSGSEFVLGYCDTYGNSPDGTNGVTITRTNCLGTPPEDGLDPLMACGTLPSGVGPDFATEWLSYDYRLLAGSPAIDAGTPTGAPITDIEGTSRDATPDMGAYELAPDVYLTPPTQTNSGALGAVVAHQENLFNVTGAVDSFSLTLGDHVWDTALSTDSLGPIANGDSVTFTVYVTVPTGVDWYSSDTVVITATSVASPTVYSDTAPITTQAYAPPQITVLPNALTSTQYVDDMTTQPVTISNGNGITLTFDVVTGSGAGTALEDILSTMNSDYQTVIDAIPNRYDFSEGETGTCISDGGNDMYDGGNCLSTNYGGYIEYSDNLIVDSNYFGGSGRYFTRKYPGLFLLVADMEDVDYFEISGNLGADGSGSADGTILQTQLYGVTYYGFVKRVFDAYDPSVNHLIIVAGNPAADHTYNTDTNDDYHQVFNLTSNARLYYLLYAGSNGYYIDDTATLNIMQTFLDALRLLPPAPWFSADPVSGQVPTDNSVEVQVTFDATTMQPGEYTAVLAVRSNDPAKPSVSLPVTMTVEPSASIGWLEGTVTDAATGDPLEATVVALGQPYAITTDPDTGTYILWLDEGSYTLQVTAEGFVTATAEVDVVAQQGNTQDFALVLNVPVMEVSPAVLHVTHLEDEVTIQTLTIANNGPAPLDFSIGIGRVPDGAALEFDGIDDQLNMGTSDTLMLSGTDFTVEAWISTTHTTCGWILGKHDPGWGNGYGLTINHQDCAPNKACFDTAGDHMAAISTSDVNDGQWHHIAGVYDVSGTKRIFVDGFLEDSNLAPVSIPPNTDPFRVGYVYDDHSSEQFQGRIDEVRVWNVARTEAEIQSTMNTPLIGTEPGLVGYWKLNEGNGQTAYDSTANGNNGQLGSTLGVDNDDPSWFMVSPQGDELSWLTIDPITGTVPSKSSAQVQVTFDATGLQPGTYTTEIGVLSSDPVSPLVSIPVTMSVIERQVALSLLPSSREGNGLPGETVVYTFTLTNKGSFSDTFILDATGIWPTKLSADTTGLLGVGESFDFTLEVTIPSAAAPGSRDTTTITAQSAFDPAVADTAQAITTALLSRWDAYLPLINR